MNREWILFLALILCWGGVAPQISAADSVSETPPETVVEISIYDLITKPKVVRSAKTAGLPADYGKRVAEVINSAQAQLIECLKTLPATSSNLLLDLWIASSGVAIVKSENETPIPACVSEVLVHLSFPTHSLPEAVKVHLPLKLSRKSS